MSSPIGHWVLFAITYPNPLSKEYFFPCPDGRLLCIQKRYEDEFKIPEEFQQSKKIAAVVEQMKTASGGLDVDWQTYIKPLVTPMGKEILEYNAFSRDLYRAYKSDPCNPDKDYSTKISAQITQYHQMTLYKETLRTLIEYARIDPHNPENIKLLEELCKMRGCENNPYFIDKKFKEEQESMKDFIERGRGPNAS